MFRHSQDARRRRARIQAGMLGAILLALVCGSEEPARAESGAPKVLREIGIDQKLNEQIPLDLTFRDEMGREVKLGSYFGRKPVVLALVYYKCPMLCTLVLNGVLQGLTALSFDVGKEFEVVTVSFDPRETPELAAEKKKNYIAKYNRAGAAEGWHFLTGDEEPIRRLTQAVGFRYVWDDKTEQYAHASGITIVTPSGKLARYLYGVEYAPRDLQFALMEASNERIGSKVDQLLLYCYHYDPVTGRYGLAIMNMIRTLGALTVGALVSFVAISLRRERRRRLELKPA